MSDDDLFDAFGGDDIYEDDEEMTETVEGEGQNRTFIIAVAVLGGLLVCALIAFGVWAFVLNRPQPAQVTPTETPTPTADVAVEMTETAESVAATQEAASPTPTETPEPTSTSTPVVGPTSTPTSEAGEDGEGDEAGEEDGEGGVASGDAEPTATSRPRRTPTPTRTPRSSPTPRNGSPAEEGFGGSGPEELADTGLGEWVMVGAAVVLIAVMVVARKMRHAS
jgi:cytoskeletal protein RodZ